jgi:nucleotide-binding universal stress UspA family protein
MHAIQKILIPVDFSACSSSALRFGLDLARKLGAEVHLLHVWQIPTLAPLDSGSRSEAESLVGVLGEHARTELDQLMNELATDGVRVGSASSLPGDPAHEIVRAVEEKGYDLVVMGTHGRTGLDKLLVGSVAEKVVRHAKCPVLTLRTRPERPA